MQSTDALLANVEALQARKDVADMGERLKTVLAEQAAATALLAEKEGELELAQIKVRESSVAWGESTEQVSEYMAQSSGELDGYRGKAATLTSEIERLRAEEAKLAAEAEDLTAKMEALDVATEQQAAQQDSASASTAALVAEMDALKSAYDESYEAARKSIDQQIGLWDKMDNKTVTSAKNVSAALDTQIKYLADYSSNMDGLMSRNIDGVDALAKSLSDGSAESAAILAGLATATDEEIIRIIEKLGSVERGKVAFSEQMGMLQADMEAKLDDIAQRFDELPRRMDMFDKMGLSGQNTIHGYIQGIDRESGALYDKMQTVAQRAIQAFRDTLGERSPAVEFIKSGENSMLGYIKGIEGETDAVRKVMENAAGVAMSAFEEAAIEAQRQSVSNLQGQATAIFEAVLPKAKDFDAVKAQLDFARSTDVITQEEYYRRLAQARDKYLTDTKSRDKYLSVTAELYSYEKRAYEQSLKDAEAAEKERAKEHEKLVKEQEKLVDEAAKAADTRLKEASSGMKAFADEAKQALGEIQAAYEAVVKQQDAMAGKLGDYGGLVDTRTIRFSDGTSEDITSLANLDRQMEQITQYGNTLEALRERGLSEDLMSRITNMSVDDAVEYGRLLLEQSEEDFNAYNEKWGEKQRIATEIAQKYYEDEINTLKESYDEKLQESLAQLQETAYSSGEYVVEGLIDGMKAKETELRAEVDKLAALIDTSLRTGLKIQSPSKLTEELGRYTVEGFEVGYQKELEQAKLVVLSSLPTETEAVPQQRSTDHIGALAGMMNTMFAGMGDMRQQQTQPGDIVLQLPNGVEIFRWMLSGVRQADAQSPENVRDWT